MSLSGGTILCPYARHVILHLILVQPRKRPVMAENFLTGMGGSRGGRQVVHTPQKYHKKDFLSNTGQDPLKNRKATGPEFNLGPSSRMSAKCHLMVFCWRADDGPL